MDVGAMGKLRLVSQLRTDREPRKERTMSLLVVSVATKPVMSDLMELEVVSVRTWYWKRFGLLLELSQCVCVSGLYPGAVSLRTSNFCVGAVVISETVCCCGVLAEEFELTEDVGRYRWITSQIWSMFVQCTMYLSSRFRLVHRLPG